MGMYDCWRDYRYIGILDVEGWMWAAFSQHGWRTASPPHIMWQHFRGVRGHRYRYFTSFRYSFGVKRNNRPNLSMESNTFPQDLAYRVATEFVHEVRPCFGPGSWPAPDDFRSRSHRSRCKSRVDSQSSHGMCPASIQFFPHESLQGSRDSSILSSSLPPQPLSEAWEGPLICLNTLATPLRT
jgi:hypothetical protein